MTQLLCLSLSTTYSAIEFAIISDNPILVDVANCFDAIDVIGGATGLLTDTALDDGFDVPIKLWFALLLLLGVERLAAICY